MEKIFSSTRVELEVLDNVLFGQVPDSKQSFYALTLAFPPCSVSGAPIPVQWKKWKAGQFVMIRPVDWENEILWARPFSIARVTSRGLILFFQTNGRGTQKLAQLKSGDKVLAWGPLGTSYAIEPETPTLLLAGGIGIVPFCGYMDQHPYRANLHMLFGFRTSIENYPLDTIAQHIEVDVFHEKKPKDLDIFLGAIRESMQEYANQKGLVLACGPEPLLKYIWKLSKELNIRTQLSLENKMACGVGACLGCVAKTSEHWADSKVAGLPVQTCTSGPVFWAHDLDFEEK